MACRYIKSLITTLFILTYYVSGMAHANSLNGQFITGGSFYSYSTGANKKSVTEYSATIYPAYLDRFKFMAGIKQLDIDLSGTNTKYVETQWSTGAHLYAYSDLLQGRIGAIYYHHNSIKDARSLLNTNGFGLSFLNNPSTFYLDAIYTRSEYPSIIQAGISDVVSQNTISIEFQPIVKNSWISLQYLSLNSSNKLYIDDRLHTLRLQWKQMFTGRSGIVVGAQLGDAKYFVLHRLNILYNYSDIVLSSYWVDLFWQLKDQFSAGLSLSRINYQNSTQIHYSALGTSAYFSIRW
jgi:hypothetical protein